MPKKSVKRAAKKTATSPVKFKQALDRTEEIVLTVTERELSGRTSSRPVWFVKRGRRLYLLPVKGSDSKWYRHVLETPTVTLTAKGQKWTARATPITDPAKVHEVVEMFRAKYGADDVKKYYSKLDVAVSIPLP